MSPHTSYVWSATDPAALTDTKTARSTDAKAAFPLTRRWRSTATIKRLEPFIGESRYRFPRFPTASRSSASTPAGRPTCSCTSTRAVSPGQQDELLRRRLATPAGIAEVLATGLPAALPGHIQRRRQGNRRPLESSGDGSSWEHDFDLTYTKRLQEQRARRCTSVGSRSVRREATKAAAGGRQSERAVGRSDPRVNAQRQPRSSRLRAEGR